ncbi:MAG: Cro/C1-type DNA-binding domain [Firmicutes bacterium]|nr:Cro/C1-type DNA-binding domain [Bacillota bacterium]
MEIQELMKRKHITPYRLAKLSGVSQSQISRILSGKTMEPKKCTLVKIAVALGVSVSELISEKSA